jgi:hypothetical protein
VGESQFDRYVYQCPFVTTEHIVLHLMESFLEPPSAYVPPEAVALFNSVGYTFVGLSLGLIAFLCVRKFLFFLTWRSFRDGPYVVGQHQWRPGNLAGYVPSHTAD